MSNARYTREYTCDGCGPMGGGFKPLVVKVAHPEGGRGAIVCRTMAAATDAVAQIIHREYGRWQQIVIEPFTAAPPTVGSGGSAGADQSPQDVSGPVKPGSAGEAPQGAPTGGHAGEEIHG